MAKTIETVRFTGDRTALYCRERAAVLHKYAQIVVPETHVAFAVYGSGKISKQLVGRCDVFGSNGPFESEGDTAAVDFVFVCADARINIDFRIDAERGNGAHVEASGSAELCVGDCRALAEAVVASPEDDMMSRFEKRLDFELKQELAVGGSHRELLSRMKVTVCAFAAREFGLVPTRFEIDRLTEHGIKEIDDDAARFCTECGAPLVPEAKYCPRCGKKIGI